MERPHSGAHLSLFDHTEALRHTAFITAGGRGEVSCYRSPPSSCSTPRCVRIEDRLLKLLGLLKLLRAKVEAAGDRVQRLSAESGKRIVDAAVAGIVGQSLRLSYGQAAVLAVAHAEAVAMRDGVPAGDGEADAAEARYPRHSAHRGEINAARARSPLLTSRPVRR